MQPLLTHTLYEHQQLREQLKVNFIKLYGHIYKLYLVV